MGLFLDLFVIGCLIVLAVGWVWFKLWEVRQEGSK